ncbi:MAG: transposase [Sphingomonas sp.]
MAGRRRSWSLEQKLAIVSEASGCDNLTELARRHDIRISQLYTWRRELRYAVAASAGACPCTSLPRPSQTNFQTSRYTTLSRTHIYEIACLAFVVGC